MFPTVMNVSGSQNSWLHLPPSIGLLEFALVVSQVSRKMLVRHALVRAQGDDHFDLRRRRQGLPHGLQQQGKWAGPGAVGNHEADSLVLQTRTRHRGSDELSDLLRLKDLTRPTENRSIGLRGHPLSRRHGVTVPLGYSAAQVHLTAN